MMPRTLLSLLPGALLLALPACSPESTSPLEESASDEITAIHIAQAGIPVASVLRTGALGSMSFELLLEARDGTMHRHDDTRTVWGSTHPSIVDEVFRLDGEMFVYRHQNGRARILAEVGPFRDTVIVDIQQVATAALLDADTLVTLTPNARDVTGATTLYHTFRFGAERVDSNGFVVPSTARIDYEAAPDAPFDVFPDSRGDTVSIAGRDVGDGRVVVRFAGRTDTLPVQVTDRYRVLRLTEFSNKVPRPLPFSITIPRGTAVIFRNETSSPATVTETLPDAPAWRSGAIPPGGYEAQLFNTPGVFEAHWRGELCRINVTH